jgi:hypothetical protein
MKPLGKEPSCRAPFGRFNTDSPNPQACPSLILRPSIFFLHNSTPQCTHADSYLLSSHTPFKMAAAIKAINAKIRSNKVLDYFCSTRKLLSPADHSLNHHPYVRFALPKGFVFLVLLSPLESQWRSTNKLCAQPADFWGPASNFGIPIAAVMDTQKDPEMYAKTSHHLQWLPSSLTFLCLTHCTNDHGLMALSISQF